MDDWPCVAIVLGVALLIAVTINHAIYRGCDIPGKVYTKEQVDNARNVHK